MTCNVNEKKYEHESFEIKRTKENEKKKTNDSNGFNLLEAFFESRNFQVVNDFKSKMK